MKLPVLRQQCRFCNGRGRNLFRAFDENRRVTDSCFEYFKCESCSAVFLSEVPQDLSRYYQDEYYDVPTVRQLEVIAAKDDTKVQTLLRFIRRGRLLEIGPAFGVFAWQAKQAGFEVDVIEMDERCCAFLSSVVGVNTIRSRDPETAIRELPRHEVIALWHVLEHLPKPLAVLQEAAANLAIGGVLLIAMPNPDSFQFKILQKYWPHLDAPRHITLIPEHVLSRKAQEFGLEKVYVTANDSDARSWNRFGWQRLLMNRFSGKTMQRAMFVLGYALSLVMAPLDQRGFSGSAYTVVFRKSRP